MSTLTISHADGLKPRVSRALLLSMKNAVLGDIYELSVAFVGRTEIRRLNRTYRDKDVATDILSFPLSKTEGEIVLCMEEIEAQAPLFDQKPSHFLLFLFIHGLCHLKGMRHSATMEALEKKFRTKFGI